MSRILLTFGACVAAAAVAAAGGPAGQAAAPAPATGTVEGHVRLTGTASGSIIRMGADPVCAAMTRGRRILSETVVVGGGGLMNVFVNVTGSFPASPAPADPITPNQQECMYQPHVLGARVGQILQIKNSDQTLHNVHSLSTRGNDFNASQPNAGMLFKFPLKSEEVLLHVKCDVHSWMSAYIGIVNNPYFAVSGDGGTFRIANVPAGRQTVQAWHERFGPLSQTVDVKPGETTTVDFAYTGTEKGGTPGGFALREITVPDFIAGS
jgi:plastocyanin